jgi:hypothetical protein
MEGNVIDIGPYPVLEVDPALAIVQVGEAGPILIHQTAKMGGHIAAKEADKDESLGERVAVVVQGGSPDPFVVTEDRAAGLGQSLSIPMKGRDVRFKEMDDVLMNSPGIGEGSIPEFSRIEEGEIIEGHGPGFEGIDGEEFFLSVHAGIFRRPAPAVNRGDPRAPRSWLRAVSTIRKTGSDRAQVAAERKNKLVVNKKEWG